MLKDVGRSTRPSPWRRRQQIIAACAAACALAMFAFIAASPSHAQRVVQWMVEEPLGLDVTGEMPAGEKPNSSFTLPTQSNDFKDSLDEFQRMVKHEQWEKAFAALDAISKKATTGYVDRGDGIYVPSRLLVRGLLGQLPAAGKSAYRLFYDPQAQALWDQATGKLEAEQLSAILTNHLISSLGDRAGDRLGDLYFERGDFEQAINSWQAVLGSCPDSKIPPAQLLAKVATALSRSNRLGELAEVQRTLAQRHAADAIQLGGNEVNALEYVTQLASAQQAGPVETASLPPDIPLPESNEPSWQFTYASKTEPNLMLVGNQQVAGNPFQLMDVYGRPRSNDFVIPAAADDQRVYVNIFGIEMAFDIQSGKLVWRSGKLHQLNLQNARQMAAPERYSMLVQNDRTWAVTRDPQQANQQGAFALIVRDANTGKEIFSSRRSLSSWSILGPPFVHGDTVFVGAHRNGRGRELSVLQLNANDGKLQKTINIGNYAVDQNQLYTDRVARPTFCWHLDRLLVDTHSGALVSLNPGSGAIDWGVLYESPAPPTGYYYNYQPPGSETSQPMVVSGLVFCKGMRSPRLMGVAGDGPRTVWSRPVATGSVLIGADSERLYLAGSELAAYHLGTQELLWATPLPVSADWSLPLVTRNRLYQFTSRGVCEVDKASGTIVRIFRGADLEGLGGSLFVTPTALITVSNYAITAYPLAGSNEVAKAPEGEPPVESP